MKAFVMTQANSAFELQDQPDLTPSKEEDILIAVDAFGLNYADVMARKGLYQDCPPMPCVVGYEALGHITQIGLSKSTQSTGTLKVGDRVVAFTRFGGYATQVLSRADMMLKIPNDMDAGVALALAVQYSTAWYCAMYSTTIIKGDTVLVQAAAGGVGTALVQICKMQGAVVYGTAGSQEKLDYLKHQGVDYPINYREERFDTAIKRLSGTQQPSLDVVFDSLGASDASRAWSLLAPGGRMIMFGVASTSDSSGGLWTGLKTLFGFGFYAAALLIMQSRGLIGCNMLRIADHKPHVLANCMRGVLDAVVSGKLKPVVGKVFDHTQLADAHAFLEGRKSVGKVIVKWSL